MDTKRLAHFNALLFPFKFNFIGEAKRSQDLGMVYSRVIKKKVAVAHTGMLIYLFRLSAFIYYCRLILSAGRRNITTLSPFPLT